MFFGLLCLFAFAQLIRLPDFLLVFARWFSPFVPIRPLFHSTGLCIFPSIVPTVFFPSLPSFRLFTSLRALRVLSVSLRDPAVDVFFRVLVPVGVKCTGKRKLQPFPRLTCNRGVWHIATFIMFGV